MFIFVWNESSRVLKNKGVLIAGLQNPYYGFLIVTKSKKVSDVKHSILHQHWIIYQRMKFQDLHRFK